MEPRVAHWLRANESSRMPRRHVIIDTEARARPVRGGHEQSWRLGAVACLDLNPRRKTPFDKRFDCDTPTELWNVVCNWCRPGRRTVLWAHNLAYDLRISGAFVQLPARGYRLDWITLDAQTVTAHWSSPAGTLVMSDLYSWLPHPLDRIRSELGLPPAPPLPHMDNPEPWRERCRSDVDVTVQAVRWLLDWLEREDMGCWQPTGAGQSHAAFRHRFMTHKLLVHDDPLALEAERRACWTGRCEVWRHGHYPAATVHEYDLHAAYARIAHECELPTRLIGVLADPTPRALRRAISRYRVLADVDVTVSRPVAPVECDGRIYWPEGTFHTALWDTELELVRQHGTIRTVRVAWCYERAPALSAWAAWALDCLDHPPHDESPLLGLLVKHWSRALIGRLGLRYRRWDLLSSKLPPGLSLDTLIEDGRPAAGELLHVGHDLLALADMEESPSSLPQITGWIMAECRRRLWHLISAAGPGHLYYVDTDSLLVDREGARALDELVVHNGAYGLRHKRTYIGAELRAPRNIRLGQTERIAGVPRGASSPAPGVYDAEVWQGLPAALRTARPDRVLVYDRRFELRPKDRRRHHRSDGSTASFRLSRRA